MAKKIYGPEDVTTEVVEALQQIVAAIDARFEQLEIPLQMRLDITTTLALSYLGQYYMDPATRAPAVLTIRRLRDQLVAMADAPDAAAFEQVMQLFAATPIDGPGNERGTPKAKGQH